MSPALDLMNSAPAPDDLVGEWGSGNSSSPPTTGVPLIDGDRVSDFWLNTLILVQLLLLGVAWYLRLPALKNGRRPDIKPNEALLTPPRPAPILRIVHAVCCIALAVQYALALVYDSSASHQTFHGGPASGASAAYFKACWAIAIGMWLACTVLVLAEARASLHASVSLRLWWVLNGVLATARFASDLVKVTDDDGAPAQTPTLISAAFFFPSLLLFLLALLEADTPSDRSYLSLDQPLLDEEAERARTLKMNREATASFASRLTFSWLGGVLATGSKRSLEHSDLFALQTRDGSGHNAAHLMRCWEAEAASGRKNFLRSFWVAFGPYFARTGFLKLINDGCVFLNPIFINKIVAYIEGTNDMSNAAAILCAFGMLAANQTVSLVLGQYFFRGYRQSLRVRAAVGQVVYEKALSLDHEQRQTHSVGAIVSHMQIDAQKLGDALPYLHMIWSGPLQLAIAITMLYNYLGPSGFMGLAVMVMMLPLNMKLGAKIGKYSLATMGARDKRVKFTNELLQGMRILKLFAWEKPLLEQLHQKRDKELSNIRANLLLGGVIGFLFTATPLLVTLCTFAVYTILGNKLTAATAFTALSLFNILRFPLLVIPMMITRVIDLMVVNKRLSKFMSAPARKTVFLNDGDGSVAPSSSLVFDGHYMAGEPARDGAAAIEMVNGTFKWPAARKDDDAKKGPKADGASQKAPARRGFFRGKRAATEPLVPPAAPMSDDAAAAPAAATSEEEMPPTLSDVSVELKRGMLVGVAGPVGSGKTSLLHALLGDIPQLAGRVVVRGSVAYCAQEPWIQNMSLRDNVLFGTPFDATRYARVLSACALDADLQALPNGDATEIGERGINLSGGQKARVALARACYVRADTILLDDVLSAVDAEVGATLMQKCICGLLRERGCTVVFVTHHVQWLSSCDYTMQLDAGGKVKDQGTPSIMRRVGSASTLGGEASIDIPEGAPPSLLGGAGGALSAANGLQSSSKDATKPPGISRRDTPGTTSVKASLQRQAEDKDKSKGIIQQEERARGVVSLEVWSKYFSALGCVSSVALFLMYTSAQALTILSSWWLGQWAELAHETLPDNPPFQQTTWYYLTIYGAITLTAAFLILFRSVVLTLATLRASRVMHKMASDAVVGAPIEFFDTNPLGRILNRFSVDMQVVDVQLSPVAGQLLVYTWQLVGTLTLLMLNSWYIVAAVIPLSFVYARVARYYRHSSRELQRLDSISKSPIYTSFTEALNGAATIQAFGAANSFIEKNRTRLDFNLRAGFVSAAANRWLTVRLEFLSNMLLFGTALLSVVTYQASDLSGSASRAGMAGLALSYAPTLTDTLNWMLRQFTTLETQMVSVERLTQYGALKAEETSETRATAAKEWPPEGGITFTDVVMRYRAELPDVLTGLSLQIAPREKIGIVGRTGAGKSSILVCLFRLAEIRSGTINVDGIDIAKLPLATLRSRLAIIPQDPVLFTGTLRYNLDPFNERSDAEIWAGLRQCSMDVPMQEHPEKLERQIEERGGNLSMGQRQLLCMCRALLKDSRIIVLDEATASVDMETDALIQTTLRNELGGSTVLTIAHRLETIMHCDRVIVMDGGKVAEAGPPLDLREKPGGAFAALWEARSQEH